MADNTPNDELNREVDTEALNGLPSKDLKETQEILDEIASETAPKEGDKKPETADKPELKPGEKKEEGKPETETKPGEDDGKKPEPRREVKLMPSWLHERAKADWEKREKELLDEVEKAKGTSIRQEGDKPKDENLETEKEAEALANKHGLTVDLAKDLIALTNRNGKLPSDVQEKLKAIDDMRDSAAITAEATAFNADFDRQILPLVKAEYGLDVPAEVIEQVREELKAKAYTPEYAKVPYSTIYKGEDQFRELVAPVKKGAEGGRGGTTSKEIISGEGDAPDLTQPLSDEALKGLTDEQFATYEKNMESYERSHK